MNDNAAASDQPNLTTAGRIQDLKRRYAEAVTDAEERAATKQHAKGKNTARERIHGLLDPGSFGGDGRVRAPPYDRIRDG